MRNCGVFNTDIPLSQKLNHPKELSIIAFGYNNTLIEQEGRSNTAKK